MSTDEKVLLALGFIALVAVLVFRVTPKSPIDIIAPAESQPITPDNTSKAPAYLTYNMPYIWGPPVQNFLPALNIA